MRRPVLVVAVLAALALGGCTAGSGAGDSAGSRAESVEGGGPGGSDGGAAGTGATGDDSGADEAAAVADLAAADRQVVTEGSVTLTVEHPRAAARDAAAIVEASGGHVQERVEHAGDGTAGDVDGSEGEGQETAWLVVRVPADGLTQVLAELERLGRVDGVELTSTDVTGQAQDLDARIRALQISVTRLEDLLSRAQSTSDVVAAESTLTERQSALESLQAQRARLADQVDLSTVRLVFVTEEGGPPAARAGFGGGLVTGWESLGAALSVALLVAGVLMPWALVAGVVVAATVLVRRELRRRRATTREPGPSPT